MGNISVCHCRQCSMLNNIGGAKTRILFERSEFLIATCKKKKTDRVCGCLCVCTANLGFSAEKLSWFSVGYQRAPGWFEFGKIEGYFLVHAAVA